MQTHMRGAPSPEAVLDLGRPSFHATLLQGLHEVVGADHLTHVRYDRGGRIGDARCASLLDQPMIEWTTRAYVDHLYRRDPCYGRVCAARRGAVPQVHVAAVSPHHIADAEYRQQLFEKPGFAGKVVLLGLWGDGTCYLNLYFSHPVSGAAVQLLRRCAPLLVALARRHGEIAAQEPMATAGIGPLSARERQVAELLWQGRTAKEAARALQLSPATVLTYKARLFEKARVANLKEFLLKAPSGVAHGLR